MAIFLLIAYNRCSSSSVRRDNVADHGESLHRHFAHFNENHLNLPTLYSAGAGRGN
jgi:hypothetical protein